MRADATESFMQKTDFALFLISWIPCILLCGNLESLFSSSLVWEGFWLLLRAGLH